MTAAVIRVLVGAQQRAERVAERTRIFRRRRRRKQLHQLLIDLEDRLLVGVGSMPELLVDKIRAHRFGKGGQIEVGQHDDPGVQRRGSAS